MIEVELPDGSIVEFPEGTDNATMERAIRQFLGEQLGEVAEGKPTEAELRQDYERLSHLSQYRGGVFDSHRKMRTEAEIAGMESRYGLPHGTLHSRQGMGVPNTHHQRMQVTAAGAGPGGGLVSGVGSGNPVPDPDAVDVLGAAGFAAALPLAMASPVLGPIAAPTAGTLAWRGGMGLGGAWLAKQLEQDPLLGALVGMMFGRRSR